MSWAPRLSDFNQPKYLALADAIAADIRSGTLRAGDRLPPQRDIAKALSVDLTTVTRALNEVRQRGLIDATVGRGTFIHADATPDGADREELPNVTLDLSMNSPPQPAEADLKRRIQSTITQMLSEPDGLNRLNYQESSGTRRDRNAAALWLGRRLGPIAPENTVVAGGAQSALYALVKSLFQPGDIICAGALCYPGLKAVAYNCGVKLSAVAIDRDGLIPQSFEELCIRSSPKGLYLVPTIDNPTTATLPDARRQEIADIARRYAVEIIEDDPYAELVDNPPRPVAFYAPERSWHIATLSKCVSPALRVAYVACPSAVHALQFAASLRVTNPMAPPLMSALATRWIEDGTFERVRTAIRNESHERQKIAATCLSGFDFAGSPYGHHIWLTLPDHWRAGAFAEIANRSGLAVVGSDAFDITNSPANAVRVSLGSSPGRKALGDGLKLLSTLMSRPAFATGTII